MKSQKELLRTFLFPAFFITGATGLVYQVLWERLLVLSFGYTIYSVSIVITAFMGGLALGSFIGGIVADKVENAVTGYGLAELGIGVIALLTYPLLTGLPETISSLRESLSIPYSGFSPWAFLISAGILAAPTILMGLTLPFLAKILTNAKERAANDIGSLYALNTLGAALGALLTGFILISYLGVQSTLSLAAAVNIIVGLAALALRKHAPSRVEKRQSAEPAEAGASVLKEPIFWAFGISGFVALACEVVWIRLLTPYLENSTYAFSLVLGIFLLGIAFGGFAGRTAASKTEESDYGFGVAQLLVGLATGAGFIFLFPFISNYYEVLSTHGALVKMPSLLLKESFWLFLILIPSTFFMGAGFPFVAKWAGRDFKRLGARTGKLYAANTVGSIIGALAGGFLFLPLLGTKDSVAFLVALNFVNGLFVIYACRGRGLNLKRGLVVGMGVALAAFVFVLKSQDNPNLFALDSAYGKKVLAYREDPDVNVALLEYSPVGKERQLFLNLREVSGTGMVITPWMTHLPVLFFEEGTPLRMLNIGLGIGNTFTTALEYPNIRIEVLELVPSVVDLFTEFNPKAKDALANSRGRVIVGDGRNYVLSTKERYDIVLIDPTPPLYGTGAVNLYTMDFFNVVKSKLTPDGLLVLRIPISADDNSVKLLLRTAMESFTNVSLWMPPSKGSGFTVVASVRDHMVGEDKLLERFRSSPAYNALSPKLQEMLVKVRPVLVGDRRTLGGKLAGIPVVTDDRPYLEFPLFRDY